jgi:hypothetical protein
LQHRELVRSILSAGSERVSTTPPRHIQFPVDATFRWGYTSSTTSLEEPEAFVDKPDLADLLAQLVCEEFGHVLPEKSEEPHLHARIDAVIDARGESVAPPKIAQ